MDFGIIESFADALSDMSLQRQVSTLKRGMEAGTRPVVAAAQSLVDEKTDGTGALKRSMGSVVRVYQNGDLIVGVMGPRRGVFLGSKVAKTRDGRSRRPVKDNRPSKYAHLVEFGSRLGVATGRHGSENKGLSFRKGTMPHLATLIPRPFLRPAFDSKRDELLDELGKSVGIAAINEFNQAKRSLR